MGSDITPLPPQTLFPAGVRDLPSPSSAFVGTCGNPAKETGFNGGISKCIEIGFFFSCPKGRIGKEPGRGVTFPARSLHCLP
ncbi:MAG: hypothetical protein CM15mV74_540 [uncultured marine virus]|nr:MAG: hypothetical protein CM15mV74_540 [uncultured marine virus]